MRKINPDYIKYLRPVVGGISLAAGAVFMLVPFIPLGYVMLAAGLFLLAPYIPGMKKLLDKLKKKDNSGIVTKVEENIENGEEKAKEKLRNDTNNQNKENS